MLHVIEYGEIVLRTKLYTSKFKISKLDEVGLIEPEILVVVRTCWVDPIK